MKIRKAFATLAATGILAAALAAPALAADKWLVYPSVTSDSTVTAEVTQSYTVVIPDKVDFGKLDETSKDVVRELPVRVKILLISKDEKLDIAVKGDDPTGDAFTIRTPGGASIAYEVYDQNSHAVQPNGLFASVPPVTTNNTQTDVSGQLKQTSAVISAGNYSGTITFTCTVKGVNP